MSHDRFARRASGVRRQWGLYVGAATCACASLGALAAEQSVPTATDTGELSEVVVTASRFGAQNLQTVPISITALDTSTLEREGLQSLPDITRNAPGITVQDAGGGQNTIVIRGIVSVGTADATNVEDQTIGVTW